MEKHSKAYYKFCIVPMCKNNNKTAPDKVYFHMPKDANVRKKWCKAMRRDNVSCLSSLHCCEDHFNIENDTENYIKYKIMALEGQKVTLLLKKGVVPHIFQCKKKDELRPPPERKAAFKRKRQALVNEALAEAARAETAISEAGPSTASISQADLSEVGPSTASIPQADLSQAGTSTASIRYHMDVELNNSENKIDGEATSYILPSNVPGKNLLKVDKAVQDPPPAPESEQSSQSSSGAQSQAQASPEVPIVDPLTDQPGLRVEKSSSGNQLVIRVSDKHDSKTNVFNRFSVSDGYFENNIIVKEEQEDHQHENEESSEQMEAEEEPKEFSPGEEMFPAVQAVLGDQESGSEDTSKALKELNDTFRKFVSEYSERTQALRERTALDRERILLDREKLALDRARLQYEMDTFKTKNGSAPKSDS